MKSQERIEYITFLKNLKIDLLKLAYENHKQKKDNKDVTNKLNNVSKLEYIEKDFVKLA